MRMLFFLVFALGIVGAKADSPSPAAGIIVLKAVAGYPAQAIEFNSIRWLDNDGGLVIDGAGNQTRFVNDGIGRIIYFDQSYYEEVDHNQNWVNWRAGLQSRELVVPPVDAVSLAPDDLPHLRSEQAVLQDIVQRFPSGQALVGAIIDQIKTDITNLSAGQVLQNGKWIAASGATAGEGTPVIGQANRPVTFTTKDGRKYTNAKVMLTDSGVSVLTSDGGGSVALDQLPDDLSGFPKNVQNAVQAQRPKPAPVAAEAPKTSGAAKEAAPPPSYWQQIWNFAISLWSKGTSSSSTPASTNSGSATPDGASTNSAPTNSGTAHTNSATATPAAPAAFDPDAVVMIKGDKAEGTGFLTKTADGPVVITNLHVIAGNPHARILTTKGEEIIPLSLKGASDRDIAMFLIKDNHYSYLQLARNVDSGAAGDPTVIPGNSEGGEVTLKTDGKVVGVGPQRVEFSNPIYHGNSGGPVLDLKTGQVVAVVVGATIMKPTDALDKDSFANANSAIKGPVRYFGLRLDTVPEWQVYDQDGFVSETLFLQQFHDDSRALDSFLNGAGYEKETWAHEEGAPDSKYFMNNEKVRTAAETFSNTVQSHDKRTSLQELVWSLGTVADQSYNNVQNLRGFYPYDQDRVKYELEYRKALKGEIEKIQSSINSTGNTSGIGL